MGCVYLLWVSAWVGSLAERMQQRDAAVSVGGGRVRGRKKEDGRGGAVGAASRGGGWGEKKDAARPALDRALAWITHRELFRAKAKEEPRTELGLRPRAGGEK